MNTSVLRALTEKERLLVRETEPSALRDLDEDEFPALHAPVSTARS